MKKWKELKWFGILFFGISIIIKSRYPLRFHVFPNLQIFSQIGTMSQSFSLKPHSKWKKIKFWTFPSSWSHAQKCKLISKLIKSTKGIKTFQKTWLYMQFHTQGLLNALRTINQSYRGLDLKGEFSFLKKHGIRWQKLTKTLNPFKFFSNIGSAKIWVNCAPKIL